MIRTIVTLLIFTIVFACVQDGNCKGLQDILFRRSSSSGKKTVKKLPKIVLPVTKNEPKLVALRTIFSYHDNFKIYSEVIQEKVLNRRTAVTAINDLERFQDSPRVLADILRDTISIAVKLINEYNELIDLKEEDYLKKALYYRALYWILTQTYFYKPIADAAQKIFDSKKAQNYLAQIYKAGKEPRWTVFPDPSLNQLQNWLNRNKYDEFDDAVNFMKLIAPSRGEKAEDVPMGCTNIEVYEEILQDADEDYFWAIFGETPGFMMKIVDYAFDIKVSAHQIDVESPCKEAVPTKDIDLSTMITEGSMERYKHTSILFVRAFESKFDLHPLTEGMLLDLRRQSIRYSKLRYNIFQIYMSNLPTEMTDVLDLLQPLHRLTQKSYLYRLSKWYKLHMSHLDGSSADLNEEMNKFLETQHAKHLITDVTTREYQNNEFEMVSIHIHTYAELLKMGEQFDSALSYMMKIVFDELQEKRKQNDGKMVKFEGAKKSSKELTDLRKEKNEIREAIRNLLSYGMPTMRTTNISRQNCENILQSIDDEAFKKKFLVSTSYVKDKITELLPGGTPQPQQSIS